MTASKIIFYFCLAFVAGIFLNSVFTIPKLAAMGILIFGLILISIFWKRKKPVVFGFCILFFILGVWRHNGAESEIMDDKLGKFNDSGQEITLTGVIYKEPDMKTNSVKLKVKTSHGAFLITTNRYPEYKYGEELIITGKLKTPSENIEGFNYKDYLSKEGIHSEMSWPEIESTGKNRGSIVQRCLLSFKDKLKESLNRVMSPPQSGLLEALFFGDEENISKEWKDRFNITGTRHITAVSGMNITIISALILNFLLILGLWRNQAFYVSVILIILYILMIGAPASAIRAGIMGIIFMSAQHFGRLSLASRAVIFASVLMLMQNPLLLRSDIGFQLSFLAVTGLIYLQPLFSVFFKKIPDFFQLRYSLSATISAQIFTLPILIYNFGKISAISPIVNILVVPILPFITILGFGFSFLGMIFYPLGLVLSWPAWLLLAYITKVIGFFSEFSFSTVSLEISGWIWIILFYLGLAAGIWFLRRKFLRPDFLN